MRFFRYSPAITKGLIKLLMFFNWAPRNVAWAPNYFRRPKGSHEIFSGSSLAPSTGKGSLLIIPVVYREIFEEFYDVSDAGISKIQTRPSGVIFTGSLPDIIYIYIYI